MRVLVACEYSGTVRDAFSAKGHHAMSCDILPSDVPGLHHQGDVLDILDQEWDLLVAHPPCTFLANSGVCHLHTKEGRWDDMREGAAFFRELLNAPIPKVCVENPVMHGYGKKEIGGVRQSQLVQPWMFGHTETKATCLWLRGLPLLVPTDDVREETMALPANQRQRLHYLPPSPDRWKERSKTYTGLANAMAEQWG